MIKKIIALGLLVTSLFSFVACNKSKDNWKDYGWDLSLPELGKGGWYEVFTDDFNELDPERWAYSPHGLRWPSDSKNKALANYWCDDMVSVKDGYVYVKAEQKSEHNCSCGVCPTEGRFSGGIETRRIVQTDGANTQGGYDDILFAQAFGYFETRVKFPDANGLWSAFWLQSSNQRKIGSEGCDGTEIDVFESAFRKNNPKKMGHALLWDGYGEHSSVQGHITKLDYSLYGDFHTFALKWTPEYYVFYIDGIATWASNAGGVSKVKQFLRFSVEVDAGDKWGPHGMRIGAFKYDTPPEFVIDYVKVYQNENYEKYIIEDEKFPGSLDSAN